MFDEKTIVLSGLSIDKLPKITKISLVNPIKQIFISQELFR